MKSSTGFNIGFIGLIQKIYEVALDAKAKENIQFAMVGAEQMQYLKDVLQYYSRERSTETDKVTVDFDIILDDVQKKLSVFTDQYDAKFHIDCSLPVISVYKHEITRVFQNLISNGIKFHKERVSPKININCSDEDSHWQFMVGDNGISIPDDNLREIFKIFRRLISNNEYPETGIGLAIKNNCGTEWWKNLG